MAVLHATANEAGPGAAPARSRQQLRQRLLMCLATQKQIGRKPPNPAVQGRLNTRLEMAESGMAASE